MYISVWMHVYYIYVGGYGGQKNMSDLQEVEL